VSDQANLQVELNRLLAQIARLEWKLALEEMVLQWLAESYPEDESSADRPGRSAVYERESAAKAERERLQRELGECRSESVRVTALMPVDRPGAMAVRFTRKPGEANSREHDAN
jgi:hypothetical protein